MRAVAPWTVILGLTLLGRSAPAAAEDPTLAAAAKTLRSGSYEQKLKALEMLEAQGRTTEVEKVVLTALDDPEWEVQVRAVQALGAVGADAAQKALVQSAFRGEVHVVRVAATGALKALDAAAAADSLLKLARTSRDDQHRGRALRAVGRLGVIAAAEGLRPFLRVRETEVAAAAAHALADLSATGTPAEQALANLEPVLGRRGERTEFEVYAAGVAALCRLDHPAARRRLVAEVLALPDGDPYVPMRAARALAAQPKDDVAAALREALAGTKQAAALARLARLAGDAGVVALADDLSRLTTHGQAGVRAAAAAALGRLTQAVSAPSLAGLLRDKDLRVRLAAVTALARCLERPAFHALAAEVRRDDAPEVRTQYVVEVHDHGDPAGIAALVPFLDDGDWRPASAAAAAVGTLGVAEDLPRLAPLLKSARWEVRAAALEGLGRLRAVEAIPLLAAGLDDKDPLVRSVCLANLQILTRERLGAKPEPWLAWWRKNGAEWKLVKRSRRSAEEKQKEAEERSKAFYAHEFYAWRQRALEVLQRARILVTIGAWDHVERVLEHLEIRHTLLRAQELKEAGLNPNQVLLVNCEGTQDKEGQERIRWFVNVGGYLMTTDWALVNTVQTCFPGYLVPQHQFSTGNDVVRIEEAQPGHPWTRGVFEHVPALMWWLEIQAFPVQVGWPERVDVLVDSAQMRAKYGSSTMAASFRFGLGKVQHSVSHFFLQEEGLVSRTQPRERMIFAADHLGLPLAQIRRLAAQGRFAGALTDDVMRELAPHYSMFRLIVNVVKEKEDWVEDL